MRDCVSHGEVEISSISPLFVERILCIFMYLCGLYCPRDQKSQLLINSEKMKEIDNFVSNYQSICHPRAIIWRQLCEFFTLDSLFVNSTEVSHKNKTEENGWMFDIQDEFSEITLSNWNLVPSLTKFYSGFADFYRKEIPFLPVESPANFQAYCKTFNIFEVPGATLFLPPKEVSKLGILRKLLSQTQSIMVLLIEKRKSLVHQIQNNTASKRAEDTLYKLNRCWKCFESICGVSRILVEGSLRIRGDQDLKIVSQLFQTLEKISVKLNINHWLLAIELWGKYVPLLRVLVQ